MRILAALVAMIWSSGCRAPQPAPGEQPLQSVTPTTATASAPTITASVPHTGAVLFCAHGGQGVLPADAKPDDYHRVVLLFEVTMPEGSPTETLKLTSLVLEDAGGKPLARMRTLISIERAARVPLTNAWQSAIDDHGPPFDGRYAVGVTRVRVEAWLDGRPAAPAARVRVVLAGATGPVEFSGAVAGEWPTG